ncbi:MULTISPECIES: filamentous hemagglutinin N-terminal domain-containing protein [Nostoc]|uniref:S-layer family protein n=2 Tax=Nostoc TaxID=1177 RepID=A0ABR8I558_9NOSO|nr:MULTISPECIES: S-layer family protein [Nostoc]MBD2563814.1 S-layer family protein [Nostoc linckia FACHB-391]MBD2646748.1 S-layer family protein [Nostoc foliaceum FACHB-393]
MNFKLSNLFQRLQNLAKRSHKISKWRSLFLITFHLVTLEYLVFINTARAQITPDNSLGAESSVVTSDNIKGIISDRIEGGALRGANLFHSFREFNVGEERGAYFSNPAVIENILSRVTGHNTSHIYGTLGVLGNANLFVINPNGIVFGKNARLDVGGSFLASTANNLIFDNGLEFSATNPQTSLLSVNIPIGLQFRENPQSIINHSIADDVGLKVAGKTLSLIGGDISLDGGRLTADGGQVFLGSLTGAGTIGLRVDSTNLAFTFPQQIKRADVKLDKAAEVNVSSGEGGSIAIYAKDVTILEASKLIAGIASELGSINSKAGDIEIDATGAVNLANDSSIINSVPATGIGNAGDIKIKVASLVLTDNSSIESSTYGPGKAGNLKINTEHLSIKDGAEVSTSTYSSFVQGDAGNLSVQAKDLVEVVGTDAFENPSSLASQVNPGAKGKGGDLSIETRRLSVRDGAQVSASTSGIGNAGNLTVHASDSVELSGESLRGTNEKNPKFPGGLFAQVNITRTEKQGQGKGGKLTIETGHLSISDGSKVQVSTFGNGNSGDLLIYASNVEVFETPKYNYFSTGIFAEVADPSPDATGIPGNPRRIAKGNGGNLTIKADQLSIRDGGRVSVSTRSQGNAGKLFVRAKDLVEVVGIHSEYGESGLTASVTPRGKGTGGDLTIETRRLNVRDGGQVSVMTLGKGDAGKLQIHADESIEIVGTSPNAEIQSQLSAEVGSGSTGRGGNLIIKTGQLNVKDGASITSRSTGEGIAGDISIFANIIGLINKSAINAEATSQDGGNIKLQIANLILLRRDSQISTSAGSERSPGNGGNINIKADFLVAIPSEDSDITANSFGGKGGVINITAQKLFGLEVGNKPTSLSEITAFSQISPTLNGEITLNQPTFDPTQGLVELPQTIIDPAALIAQNPCQRGVGSKFIITGRGGLPPSPNEGTSSDAVQVDLVEPATGGSEGAGEQRSRGAEEKNKYSVSKPIVPAQGWIFDKNGEVMLTAYDPTGTGSQRLLNSDVCPVP